MNICNKKKLITVSALKEIISDKSKHHAIKSGRKVTFLKANSHETALLSIDIYLHVTASPKYIDKDRIWFCPVWLDYVNHSVVVGHNDLSKMGLKCGRDGLYTIVDEIEELTEVQENGKSLSGEFEIDDQHSGKKIRNIEVIILDHVNGDDNLIVVDYELSCRKVPVYDRDYGGFKLERRIKIKYKCEIIDNICNRLKGV